MKNNYFQNLQTGFTVVEMIVVVAIFAMISLAVANFQRSIFQTSSTVSGSLTTSYDARVILRTMTRELRTSSVGSNGSYPLVQAATSSITFFADIDSDNVREQVRYFLVGTNLRKGVIKPSGSPLSYVPANESVATIATNIRNSTSTPLFQYFSSSYDGTTAALTNPVSITAVRLVKINLTLDVDIRKAPVSRTYTSQVSLRNLKDNL